MRDSTVQLFGEVLFDRFPDGRAVLGGAPFNVAWHLQVFGDSPRLLSRVGRDEDGMVVQSAMANWGMDPGGLQVDEALPTGRVEVSLVDGEPHYEIVHPVAWDAIEASGDTASPSGGWLYHGTLALRDDRSRSTLDALVSGSDGKIFLDVNLREPWWDRDQVRSRLGAAHWVKLNEHELDELAPEGGSLAQRARALFERDDLEGLIVTRGAAGAVVLDRDGVAGAAPAPERVAVVDTVGAGDAFSSVMIHGLRRGWPLETALERALAFAAAICGQRGATVADPDFYTPFLEAWYDDGTR
ncbi:MAG: carbohydrate kinase [Xanthomonadales bacterium]|jgi:fructokinase|nr:carbohydrate kinase [Xanthomonadales bacterium]